MENTKELLRKFGVTHQDVVDRIRRDLGGKYTVGRSTISLWLNGHRRRRGLPWTVAQVFLAILRENGMTKDQEQMVLEEMGFEGVMLGSSLKPA